MKQKIRLAAFAAAGVLLAALLTGCAHSGPVSGETPARVYAIKGPTGVGMVHLMEEAESSAFDFHIASSAEEVTARVLNGEADIAAVPTNLAAVLHQKTGGKIQIAAVNTLGVLYVLEKGDNIRSVSDLRGKMVYSIGQGANPEYVLNYVLTQNGLTPGVDVTVEFREQAEELATLLASDRAAVAMLPEPSVTTVLAKNDGLRVALDMTAEWETAARDESRLMMGCIIVSADYAQRNPDRMKAFLSDYRSSVEKALSNVEGTAVLCEQYEIIPKADVARQAIPRCGLTYVDGEEMQRRLAGYYAVLYAANPQSVGGQLPGDDFYYHAS